MDNETIQALPNDEERRRQKIEEVRGIFAEIRTQEEEKMSEELAGIIAEAAQATENEQPSRVEKALEAETPETQRQERASFRYGEVRPAIDVRYERLPDHQRKVRTPQGDSLIARWFRSWLAKDHATLREMAAVNQVELEARYGQRAVIAITESSHAASIMPVPLSDAVIQQVNASAVMRNLVRTATSPNQQYRFPVFGKAASAMVAEGAITTASTGPVPANVLLTKHKNQWVGNATDESIMDSDFNLANALVTAAGNAIAYTEDVQICTSEGTSPDFSGSLINGVTDVSEQTATDLSWNDFNVLFFSVPKAYRNGSVILVDSVAARLLTGLLDGGSNRVLTSPSAPAVPVTDVPNVIGSVYGMPVYEVPLASGTIWIGNPSYYGLLLDPVLIIKESTDAGWATDTTHFKVTSREDGNILVADAARYMTGLDALT